MLVGGRAGCAEGRGVEAGELEGSSVPQLCLLGE